MNDGGHNMKRIRRLTVLPILAFVLATGAPSAMAAADNSAVAINQKDDTYVWRQAFKITRSNGDDVVESNGAAAVSQCERCRTAAVAFQVLIATGSASTVTPDNVAFAFNDGCFECATYAGAFQLIITPKTQIHFTESGNDEIDAIRAELQSVIAHAAFDPSVEQIDIFNAQVRSLFERLVTVVDGEMVRVGGGGISTDVDFAEG
jgi:hypothetical protein